MIVLYIYIHIYIYKHQAAVNVPTKLAWNDVRTYACGNPQPVHPERLVTKVIHHYFHTVIAKLENWFDLYLMELLNVHELTI